MSEQIKPRSGPKNLLKRVYVKALLFLLPTLLVTGRHLSRKIQSEIDYLPQDYVFALTVAHTELHCICRKTNKRSWKRIFSSAEISTPVTYTIEFRDINYAFACFSGSLSLQDALSARLFTTRGPNNTGVALTYMFTTLLHTFFFWRSAYRPSIRRSTDASL